MLIIDTKGVKIGFGIKFANKSKISVIICRY